MQCTRGFCGITGRLQSANILICYECQKYSSLTKWVDASSMKLDKHQWRKWNSYFDNRLRIYTIHLYFCAITIEEANSDCSPVDEVQLKHLVNFQSSPILVLSALHGIIRVIGCVSGNVTSIQCLAIPTRSRRPSLVCSCSHCCSILNMFRWYLYYDWTTLLCSLHYLGKAFFLRVSSSLWWFIWSSLEFPSLQWTSASGSVLVFKNLRFLSTGRQRNVFHFQRV